MLFRKKSATAPTGAVAMSLTSPGDWLTGDAIGMSTDRAMKMSTVNRCVEVLSTSMAVLPVYLMDEGSKERLSSHRLGGLLWGRPNQAMTSYDYQRLMMANQLLYGNAYAWIYRDGRTGYPLELLPLYPPNVQIATDATGAVWYQVTLGQQGVTKWIPAADMIHYKAFSRDGITGISVLERARVTLETGAAAQEYEKATWQSGGQPSGVLTTESDLGKYSTKVVNADGTTTVVTAKEVLRQEWEKIHRGADNAFRLAVLDLGLKYQPISMTNSDAQFVESNEIRVADVCRFFGVPLHLVYAGKQSYSSNEQNGIEYVNYTLLGYETQWGQEDSYKLLLPEERDDGLRIKRELKVFLRGDTTTQANWYTAMRNNGAYSVDDIRGLEDMPSVPGGDVRYASWNYGPLSEFERLSVIRALGGTVNSEE